MNTTDLKKERMNLKSVLFYTDEVRLKEVKRKIENGKNQLNQFYDRVIKTIGALPHDEIEDFPRKAIQIIQTELKSRYSFIGADDEFNLRAMGINPKPLYDDFQKNYQSWIDFEFEFIKGSFEPKANQPSIEKHFYYADTPEKQRVVELRRKMLDLFYEFKEAGLVASEVNFAHAFNPTLFKVRDKGVEIRSESTPELFFNIDKGRFNLKNK